MTRLLLAVRTMFVLLPFWGFLRYLNAETIYLKSGMYIVVTKTEQKADTVKYWVGEDEYEVAKSDVLKIEPGNGPAPDPRAPTPTSGTPGTVQDLPATMGLQTHTATATR